MTGLRFLTSVATLASLFITSTVSAAPVQGEAGLLLSKRGSFSGDGTYYNPGLGACGKTNTADQLIAAMNAPQFGGYSLPSNSPVCHSCAMVTGPLGSVKVKIVDKCPGCAFGSLDLSPTAFEHIAHLSQGRVHITWDYVACDGDEEDNSGNEKQSTNTSTSSSKDKKSLPMTSTCQFNSRCLNSGQTGKFEVCVDGTIEQQECAQGTVCKDEADSIVCTWA